MLYGLVFAFCLQRLLLPYLCTHGNAICNTPATQLCPLPCLLCLPVLYHLPKLTCMCMYACIQQHLWPSLSVLAPYLPTSCPTLAVVCSHTCTYTMYLHAPTVLWDIWLGLWQQRHLFYSHPQVFGFGLLHACVLFGLIISWHGVRHDMCWLACNVSNNNICLFSPNI